MFNYKMDLNKIIDEITTKPSKDNTLYGFVVISSIVTIYPKICYNFIVDIDTFILMIIT